VVHAWNVSNVVGERGAAVASGEETLDLVLFRGGKLFVEVLGFVESIVHGDSGITHVVRVLIASELGFFKLREIGFSREEGAVEEAVGVILDALVVFNSFELAAHIFRLDIGVLEEATHVVGVVMHVLSSVVIKEAVALLERAVVDTFELHFHLHFENVF